MKFKAITQAVAFIHNQMRTTGERVHTERWQAMDVKNNPAAEMVEILNVSFTAPMNMDHLHLQINPNLPWADNHFEERMCGSPINPGVEWAKWPWAGKAAESLKDGIFNHNYMERYWPKLAGYVASPTSTALDFVEKANSHLMVSSPLADLHLPPNRGIRNNYGDLGDVIQLLADEPLTRQAYLPIWHPEDTGAQNTGRKPCTLGYHFIMRNNKLHIRYDIRSCDLYRHFDDDVYMTIRLAHRVLQMLREQSADWKSVGLGDFTMNITSLHMFVSDFQITYRREPNV